MAGRSYSDRIDISKEDLMNFELQAAIRPIPVGWCPKVSKSSSITDSAATTAG